MVRVKPRSGHFKGTQRVPFWSSASFPITRYPLSVMALELWLFDVRQAMDEGATDWDHHPILNVYGLGGSILFRQFQEVTDQYVQVSCGSEIMWRGGLNLSHCRETMPDYHEEYFVAKPIAHAIFEWCTRMALSTIQEGVDRGRTSG